MIFNPQIASETVCWISWICVLFLCCSCYESLSSLYKAKRIQTALLKTCGPRADNDNASARCRFDRIFLLWFWKFLIFARAQRTLLGPQINNMPSKSHVIVLFILRFVSIMYFQSFEVVCVSNCEHSNYVCLGFFPLFSPKFVVPFLRNFQNLLR